MRTKPGQTHAVCTECGEEKKIITANWSQDGYGGWRQRCKVCTKRAKMAAMAARNEKEKLVRHIDLQKDGPAFAIASHSIGMARLDDLLFEEEHLSQQLIAVRASIQHMLRRLEDSRGALDLPLPREYYEGRLSVEAAREGTRHQ